MANSQCVRDEHGKEKVNKFLWLNLHSCHLHHKLYLVQFCTDY